MLLMLLMHLVLMHLVLMQLMLPSPLPLQMLPLMNELHLKDDLKERKAMKWKTQRQPPQPPPRAPPPAETKPSSPECAALQGVSQQPPLGHERPLREHEQRLMMPQRSSLHVCLAPHQRHLGGIHGQLGVHQRIHQSLSHQQQQLHQ